MRPPAARVRRFVAALNGTAGDLPKPEPQPECDADDVGSNAWALAPSRTKSGKAILLRNPHLAWTAGYYEAHLTVPGVVDFYGDFRIGGPFIVIGGFNKYLGFATTNSNSGDLTEFYALDARSGVGRSLPDRRRLAAVEAANRSRWSSWTTAGRATRRATTGPRRGPGGPSHRAEDLCGPHGGRR